MILDRFFKPKWQHSDPQIRKQALQNLSPSDPNLARLAYQDHDPEVRLAALGRLTELGLLRQAATQDPNSDVREFAKNRLQELLAGTTGNSPSVAARIEALASLDSAWLNFLVMHAKEAELRLAVLERLTEETLLEKVAINDPVIEVRLAALERIHTVSLLENIAKHIRNRDKRTYRRVRDRLDALRNEHLQATRLRQLGEEMATLRWDGEGGLHAARFVKLEQEWRQLETHADTHLREHYEQARVNFLAGRRERVARKQARLDCCAALESLINTLHDSGPLTAELQATVQETLHKAQHDWAQCADTQDPESRRLEQRFDGLVQAVKGHEHSLQRNRERAERLRAVLRDTEELLNQPSEVLEADIAALRRRWTGLERPESNNLAMELQNEFDTMVAKLRARLQRQAERKDQELQELHELIGNLETMLAEGKLQQAISLYELARQRLQHNIGLSRSQMAALETRLQASTPILGELRGWRRWGTNQAREHLCEEAETLIGLQVEPPVIAARIKELRATWKSLEGPDGPAVRALWKRFDKACERAYEPCQSYFDALTEERQRNLVQKQDLCQQLEQFVATTDWERTNWREADRLWREVQKQWHKIGPVNRADKKAQEQRYTAALAQLETHLQPEREREIKRRRDLIHRLQVLADSDDVAAAVETAKRAQAEWHPKVQATQREEQALWRQFRTQCDAIFARRQTEKQAAEAQRQAHLASKTALCDDLDALIEASREVGQLRMQLQHIQEQWGSFGPVPKAAHTAIEQRFAAACARAERRAQELKQAFVQDELRNLRARASLCATVEALLYEPQAVDVAAVVKDVQEQWQALPALTNAAAAERVQRRFDTACRAVTDDSQDNQAETLEETSARKQVLCLRMEIIAGVDSPPEFVQARMQYQVSRLSESLTRRNGAQTSASLSTEASQLEEEWYFLRTLPPAQEGPLADRFKRALAALG